MVDDGADNAHERCAGKRIASNSKKSPGFSVLNLHAQEWCLDGGVRQAYLIVPLIFPLMLCCGGA